MEKRIVCYWRILLVLNLTRYVNASGTLFLVIKNYTDLKNNTSCTNMLNCDISALEGLSKLLQIDIKKSEQDQKLNYHFESWPFNNEVTLRNLEYYVGRRLLYKATRNFWADNTTKEVYHNSSTSRSFFTLRAICDPNFYSKTCNKWCAPQNSSSGHYWCSKKGDTICHEGWIDPDTNCTTAAAICFENQFCRNGGKCTMLNGSKFCECGINWSGPTCSLAMGLSCAKNADICVNGGVCRDLFDAAGILCDCADTGFQGPRCDIDIDECQSKPCKPHLTCYNLPGRHACLCKAPYYGPNCKQCNSSAFGGRWECSLARGQQNKHFVFVILTLSLLGLFFVLLSLLIVKTLCVSFERWILKILSGINQG